MKYNRVLPEKSVEVYLGHQLIMHPIFGKYNWREKHTWVGIWDCSGCSYGNVEMPICMMNQVVVVPNEYCQVIFTFGISFELPRFGKVTLWGLGKLIPTTDPSDFFLVCLSMPSQVNCRSDKKRIARLPLAVVSAFSFLGSFSLHCNRYHWYTYRIVRPLYMCIQQEQHPAV